MNDARQGWGARKNRLARRAGADGAPLMEGLEQRALFSNANFASVGFAFETRPFGEILTTVYSTEGRLETTTGAVTGTTYAAGTFDRFNAGSLLFSSVQQLADGRYLRHPNRGTQGTPEESNGARFLSRDGFGAGWWFADFGDGEKEVEWIVERPTNATRAEFEGTWRFSVLGSRNVNDDFYNGYGDLVISSSSVRWYVDGGYMPRFSSSILSTSSDGLLRTSAREYFYMSADRSVMIFADMAEDDDEIYIGVAVREEAHPTRGQVAGDYLLAWAFADGPADYGPNGEVDYAQRYLRLESDGDYRIWDLDDYDSGRTGNSWVINRGEWYISTQGEVVLQEQHSGDLARFAVGNNRSTLMGVLLQDAHTDDPVLGLATRAFPVGTTPPDPDAVFTIPGEGSFGRPLVFELGTDDVWEVVDLIREAGGPTIIGKVVSWIDPKDGRAYAAGMSSAGLILYSEPATGNWTYRNLSTEAFGQAIMSGLQVMITPDNLVNLTGLNASGQLLRYYQRTTPAGSWAYTNIATTDLTTQGLATPAFVGPLVSYATSWGGLNVAGLDVNGRIWSVWWAPGQARWTVTDLSAASGAAPIAGNLAVYLTPWNGINLAGTNTAGELRVTWWVPGFAGAWRQTNLTAETGGALLRPESITSYVSEWGGLNVAGLDATTGEVKVYWWTPERTQIGWAVTSISTSLAPGTTRIIDDDIRGLAAPDRSLNIFGYAQDGSLLRYYWEPGFGGTWQAQNLSEIAVDR